MESNDEIKKPAPKWLRVGNADQYRRSKKHEERVAKLLGGRRLPRSGGLRWSRQGKETLGGDVTTPQFHVEHKRTEKNSISVKKEWMEKVMEAAKRGMKDPAIVLTFEEKNKTLDWFCVPMSVARRLLGIEDE